MANAYSGRGRHIRWDWKTWVMHDYKKVATQCGMKTTAANSGIPGVYGDGEWCPRCKLVTARQILRFNDDFVADKIYVPEPIMQMYSQAYQICDPEFKLIPMPGR